MSDPKKLRDLREQRQKVHAERQDLIEKRVFELPIGEGDLLLALDDRHAPHKVFPEEYDPDHKLRDLSDQLDAIEEAIKREQSESERK